MLASFILVVASICLSGTITDKRQITIMVGMETILIARCARVNIIDFQSLISGERGLLLRGMLLSEE